MDKGEIRRVAKGIADRWDQLSDSSRRQYEAAYRRVVRAGGHWRDVEASGAGRDAVLKAKTAYQYIEAGRALELLREADREHGPIRRQEARREAERIASELAVADYGKERRWSPGSGTVEARKRPDRKKRKRHTVARLTRGWLTLIRSELSDRDWWPFTVQALAGLRPADLRDGVEVERLDDGGGIRIRVREGVKCNDEAGQPWRGMVVTGRLGERLAARLPDGGKVVEVEGSIMAYCRRVSRAARRAGFEGVTAYTFRHAAAARMKADPGLTREDVARALGHAVDATQAKYGDLQQSARGGGEFVKIERVEAPRPVKQTSAPPQRRRQRPPRAGSSPRPGPGPGTGPDPTPGG